MMGYVGSIIKRTVTGVRDSMPVNKEAGVLVACVRTKAILESCSVQGLAVFKKVLAIWDASEASIVSSAFKIQHSGKATHANVVINDGYEGTVSSVLGVCLSTNVNKWQFFVQFL